MSERTLPGTHQFMFPPTPFQFLAAAGDGAGREIGPGRTTPAGRYKHGKPGEQSFVEL
jgi:hypothetical protein